MAEKMTDIRKMDISKKYEVKSVGTNPRQVTGVLTEKGEWQWIFKQSNGKNVPLLKACIESFKEVEEKPVVK